MAKRDAGINAGIIVGAVVGGLAAYFLSPRSGKENREMFKKKVQELNKMIENGELPEKITELFGDGGKKAYDIARKELNARLDQVQESVDEIDTDKYKSIVDDVMDRVREETSESADRLTKLKDYFMDQFSQTKEEAKSDAKKVSSSAKKAVTKPAAKPKKSTKTEK